MIDLAIRPWQEKDIDHIVNYWFKKNDEELLTIGVNKAKLSSPENYKKTLQAIYDTPLNDTRFFYAIWLIDNKPIGYSALKDIEKSAIASMHLHMWNTEHRGKGYGAKLFCMSALKFYNMFDLKLILCEPRSNNPMPNKMLTKVGFKKWRTYKAVSSEIALVCELNSYIIDVKTATNYLQR